MPELLRAPALESRQQDARAIATCSVLVMSCDAYRDLWQPFFTLFARYWPDCPFPVYLGSNHQNYDSLGVTTIAAGTGEWSDRLRICLEQIDTNYVLLLLEDYFLNEPIPTRELLADLNALDGLGGVMLRLYPLPGPDTRVPGNTRFGRVAAHAPYRVSTQPAFWNREELLRLLVQKESIWDFEWQGTVRSRELSGLYATWTKAFPFRHVVERGRWFWLAARWCRSLQIGCDFAARPVMNPPTAFVKAFNRLRKNTTNAVLPARRRRRK